MSHTISTLFEKTRIYGRMIKFGHTLFALPFALGTVVLVRRVAPLDGSTLFWIIMAMVGARSAAMGFNRLADAVIDAKNPRTAGREIPSGAISVTEASGFVGISALFFIFSTAMLSWLCFWLSFPLLGLLFLYSYTKRFTWLCHFFLGMVIGMAPVAVWIAVTGTLSWKIVVLSLALLTYIAGFDILYACQDTEFDREQRLCSIPAAFGIEKALAISTSLHVISILCLASLFWLFSLNAVYLVFTGIIAILFFIEHRLVNPEDLTQVNIAFYHVNTVISVLVFVAIVFGELLR